MIKPRKSRAVITGMGVVAANGIGVEAFWQSLLARESGIRPITLFDASGHESRIAGEIPNFDPTHYLGAGRKLNRLARHTQFALVAAKMALADAGINGTNETRKKDLLIALGVSSSAFDIIEKGSAQLHQRGPRLVSPYVVESSPPQAATSALSRHLDLPAEGITISSACAAGLDAITHAIERIRQGKTAVALAGGTDAPITPLAFATFASAGLTNMRNGDPKKASRPFDRHSGAGVIGEGAGIIVLENHEEALAHGTRIYAEITGWASELDPPGSDPCTGLQSTMERVLHNAGLQPEDIDYICAHAPGHPVIDRIEMQMIKQVFGAHALRIPISSIKGVTGNALSAAGVQQVIATALAVHHGIVPPTANCDEPLEECDLDYVTDGPRRHAIRRALVNVHGLGGSNTSVVIEAFGRP